MQSVATTSPTKDSTAAATTGWRKGEEAYFASKTKDLPLRIQWTATKGKAAFARRPITQGEVILTETPLVCMQHIANADLVATCARCLRFIGTLESQVALLAAVDDDSVPPLPALDKDASILSPVVPCPGGCGVEYCGYACQKVHATAGHSLTCPGPPVADQPLGASPWRLFMQQARVTNDILVLGAAAMARIVSDWSENGHDLEAAMLPFVAPHSAPWWQVITLADPDHDPATVEADLREIVGDAITILRAVLFRPGLEPLFDVDFLGALIGAFELNNLTVELNSPVREYFLIVEALPPKARKVAIDTLAPLVKAIQGMADARAAADECSSDEDEEEADEEGDTAVVPAAAVGGGGAGGGAGAAASTATTSDAAAAATDAGTEPTKSTSRLQFTSELFPHAEGTALFSITCCMNHSCRPNAGVSYLGGDVCATVVALRDTAAGEELCISYINEEEPEPVRAAALRHYGFVCNCVRCVDERKAATTSASS